MQSEIESCLWLINHDALSKWELPLLKNAGFKAIYTPQNYPESPAYSSGSVTNLIGDWTKFKERELDILQSQNWYTSIDKKASSIINSNFSLAFITADPTQVITTLRSFDGIVVIRLFGLDSNRTYSELYKLHFTPFELAFLISNLHRIFFAAGYRELLIGEEGWLVAKSVFLPIGIPNQEDSQWEGVNREAFAVVPRIEPNSYYAESLRNHQRMVHKKSIRIGGRQHLIHSDHRILGTLDKKDFRLQMINSRCMVYASKEKRHVHYHPLEAMQMGMPVVYFKNSLLDTILGTQKEGVVSTYLGAKLLVRRMLKDWSLAKAIGEAQQSAVSVLETSSLEKDFLAGCETIISSFAPKEVLTKTVIWFCEASKKGFACQRHPANSKKLVSLIRRISDNKVSTLGDFNEINARESALRLNGENSYSRIFQYTANQIDLLNLDPSLYEISLCDQTLPKVILTRCKVARYISQETCASMAKGFSNKILESLRFSLDSLDEIIVGKESTKRLLLSIAPIQKKRILVVRENF